MKTILGLDLGSSSVGWAVIRKDETDKRQHTILGMGSRIIPMSADDIKEFTTGAAISKNAKRTQKRSQRRGYDRSQLRRSYLIEALKSKNMLPDLSKEHWNKQALWGIRAKAANEEVSLTELGRILLHLNQKRGYKSSRIEDSEDKKNTDYVTEIENRYQLIQSKKQTIGQYMYEEISSDRHFAVKKKVFPRRAYIEEFDKIINTQALYHPHVLTDEFITQLRDRIIYYQRPLKSQKGLVSVCDFEGQWRHRKSDDKLFFTGPKVSPKSSPLFQLERIWEEVNNIRIKDIHGVEKTLTRDEKQKIADYLSTNKDLKFANLLKLLNLKASDGWYGNKQLQKGLEGNPTYNLIKSKLTKETIKSHPDLLRFEIKTTSEECVDTDTGELTTRTFVTNDYESEPLYQLWHLIYSSQDNEACVKNLLKKYPLSKDEATALAKIDFTKKGYGNKSAKMICRILPFLTQGYMYNEACSKAGYNHSNSLTREEREALKLQTFLKLLPKNSLRQPIVEKVLNQMISVVNALIRKYGTFDEIHVELARELKQTKDERERCDKQNREQERTNKKLVETFASDYGALSRNKLEKLRLLYEISDSTNDYKGYCIYCGKPFSKAAVLNGEIEVEHIVPRSLLFDDSFTNKVLAHRHCNQDKNDRTAFDFMHDTKSELEFTEYKNRVKTWHEKGYISDKKRDRLLMPLSEIPNDFIDRQLRETQYISKKAIEILSTICRHVSPSSGGVTAYLRKLWGWDEVLLKLQVNQYRDTDLVQKREYKRGDNSFVRDTITDWSKRDDQRHHAIDALVVACTGYDLIHKLNTLSSQETRDQIKSELTEESKSRRLLLDRYIQSIRPYTTQDVMREANKILISYKPGKKVTTPGKRVISRNGEKVCMQNDLRIPRGPLSEETVYGSVSLLEKEKPLKYLFENPDKIVKQYIKEKVKERLAQFDNDPKRALKSIDDSPIYLNEAQNEQLLYGSCFEDKIVIRKQLQSLSEKNISDIIDPVIKNLVEKHMQKYGSLKEMIKNLECDPILIRGKNYSAIPVRSVRINTNLSAIEPVWFRDKEKTDPIGFVKPGNNHHVALYRNTEGEICEHICTFWHAVERSKYNLPVVIGKSNEVIDQILQSDKTYPDSFIAKLPDPNMELLFNMQQNQMFIMGMSDEEYHKAIEENDYASISRNLYRVQSLSSKDYFFRHHLETNVLDNTLKKDVRKYIRIKSLSALFKENPKAVNISNIGEIYFT